MDILREKGKVTLKRIDRKNTEMWIGNGYPHQECSIRGDSGSEVN